MIARVSVAIAALALVAWPSAASGSGWKHVRLIRHAGAIDAVLSFDQRSIAGVSSFEDRDAKLVVRRGGKPVIDDRYRVPSYGYIERLSLRNVWGDSQPEAVVDSWTGGNACCEQVGVGLTTGAGAGRVVVRTLSMGWHGEWHGKTFDFISSDFRFYCGFSDCANSSLPIQILAIDTAGQGFRDVTSSRPDLLRRDATMHWRAYLRERGKRNQADPAGEFVPWCADEYQLGERDRCHRALSEALIRGDLNFPATHLRRGPSFAKLVYRAFATWGYG